MQRKFVGNLFYLIFLNLLVKPFWILGIDVAVQNRVGAEEYGFYTPIFGFSILLNIVLDFGITNYNNRNIAQHQHMLRRYFSGILNVKFFLGILYIVLTLIAGYFIGYGEREINFLFILAINQFLASMILYLRSNLTGLHLFKIEGFLSVFDRLLIIIICGYLLWSDRFEGLFEIEWFVYAQFAAYLTAMIVAFSIVLAKAKFYRFKLDIPMFRVILRESLPFALLVLIMTFYYRLDFVMIERLLDDGNFQAGIYAQAYKLFEGFNMFGYLFAALLLPIFSRMIKQNEQVKQLVITAFNLLFLPSVIVAIVSFFYAKEIMDFLYLANIEVSASIFSILMFSIIAVVLTYIYGTLLTANGSLKQLNIISLIGLIVNLSLNFLLIPDYAAKGAAIATLITQAIVILLQIFYAKRIMHLPYSFNFIFKNGLAVGVLFLSGYFLKSINTDFIWVLVVLITISILLILSMKLVRINELRSIIQKKYS